MHGKKTPISIEDVAVNELDFMGEYFFRKDMPQTHFAWFQPRFSEVANWKSENWWIWSGQNWEFKHQKWKIEPSKLGIFHHHGELTWFNEVMGMRLAEAKSLWCATSFVLCPVCWCKHPVPQHLNTSFWPAKNGNYFGNRKLPMFRPRQFAHQNSGYDAKLRIPQSSKEKAAEGTLWVSKMMRMAALLRT